ncbi:MAG: PilZ domain-containing protein [Nitrospinae bacterium]|nr:PilZ domain-containing protein [Nitrospinota bacterium]
MNHEETDLRGTVRVAVYFPVRLRKVEGAEAQRLALMVKSHRSADRFHLPSESGGESMGASEFTEWRQAAPHIFAMWEALERKLDHLTWLLRREAVDEPGMEEGICLDLSAEGVRVATAIPLAPGDTVLIRLAPPTYPKTLVEAVAGVLTVGREPGPEERPVASLRFTSINSADTDELISYIFKRQREILRDQRA